MSDIEFHKIDINVPELNPEFLHLWINYVVKHFNKEIGDLTYILCSDEYILNINKQYLNHDYYTDIITFNYNLENVLSGDIYISYDTVMTNSKIYSNNNIKNELERVVIHGALHLLGFNDRTDEEQIEMTNKENWALGERKRFT